MTSMAPNHLSQPTHDRDKTWFYVKDGVADGPHESDTLVQLYITRAINDETLVWCAGEPSWRPLGSYATLTEHVSIILSGPPGTAMLVQQCTHRSPQHSTKTHSSRWRGRPLVQLSQVAPRPGRARPHGHAVQGAQVLHAAGGAGPRSRTGRPHAGLDEAVRTSSQH